MLSSNDLKAVKKVVGEEIDWKLDKRFAEFEEKIDQKMFDLRSDLATMKDEIVGMLKNHNEEHAILSGEHHRLLNQEERLEKLEKIHPQGRHLTP